jgi:hypothetical protein
MPVLPQKPVINHHRSMRSGPRELVLPFVGAAFHDEDNEGLLPISVLSQPVRVDLQVWDAASPDDTYQLLWDGGLIGVEKTILNTEEPGDPIFLEIPIDVLTEGIFSLAYRTTNIENGATDDSGSVRVEVDLTPPGRPLLGAMEFPPEIQGGLTSAELTQLGDQLVAEVSSYTGMAKHDVVQTYWGSTEGPSATVTSDDMGLQKVLITFSRSFLEALGDGEEPVRYYVTDRAGNRSQPSSSVLIQLLLEDIPSNFPAPIIDDAVGPLIDYSEARAGVNLDIPHYTGAAAFDRITVIWGNGNRMQSVQVPEGDENEDIVLSLIVPYDTIAVTPVGRVNVSYEVSRQSQLLGSSLSSPIDVFLTLPGPVNPDAPLIQGTSASNPNVTDNFIDEDDYELNGRAIITWKDGYELSDDLNLHWGQQVITQWHQINASDVAAQRDLVLPVPNATMKAQGTGPEIPVFYTINRAGNPNPANSPTANVVVRSKEELPGGADGLNGPTFRTTENGVVGPIENGNGANVTIAPYINIQKDQTLFFVFKAFDDNNNLIEEAGFTGNRELDENDIEKGYVFTVPITNLLRICKGYGEAYYRVEPAPGSNQSSTTSRTTRVRVNMSRPATGCAPI